MSADGARNKRSPASYPSSSRRWAAVSCVAIFAVNIVLIVLLRAEIEAYDAEYAAARAGISATVVRSEHFTNSDDVIDVQWSDSNGELRRHLFDVDDAADYPVGSALSIRVSALRPEQIFPEDRNRIDGTALPTTGLGLLVVASLGMLTLWTRRTVQWWRASKAPAKRHRATLCFSYSYSQSDSLGVAWMSIEDGDRTYYQRLMWEPWLPSLNDRLVIEGRRVGRGPFVVDVPGFGRLWPAGPAKSREPWMERLAPRRNSRYRLSRFGTLMWYSLITLGFGVFAGWLGGLLITGHMWLIVVYFGAAPMPVPWLPPRRFRRINGPDPTGDETPSPSGIAE